MGEIITFYSYKGGTGRSMLLANVAWLLASSGSKVLVIDWDLEAPGLHRYFKPFLVDSELFETDGLIDAIWKVTAPLLADYHQPGGKPIDAAAPALDEINVELFLDLYAQPLDFDFGTGEIYFIGAGRQGATYSERVNTFNWKSFYRLGGGLFLDKIRTHVSERYDFILIDSRTGVSDTSGICTIHLPDKVVACFTLNYQSIEGAAAVCRSIRVERASKGRAVSLYPVVTRIENSEKSKLDAARTHARLAFEDLIPNPDRHRSRSYWDVMEVTYRPYYAYEEILAPFGDSSGELGSSDSLLAQVHRISQKITGRRGIKLPVLDDRRRREIIDAYSFGPLDDDQSDAVSLDPVSSRPRVESSVQADGRPLSVYISCTDQDRVIAVAVSQALNLLYRETITIHIATDRLLSHSWKEALVERLAQVDVMFVIYPRETESTSYVFYEAGTFLAVVERKRSKMIVLHDPATPPREFIDYKAVPVGKGGLLGSSSVTARSDIMDGELAGFLASFGAEFLAQGVSIERGSDSAIEAAQLITEAFAAARGNERVRTVTPGRTLIIHAQGLPVLDSGSLVIANASTWELFGISGDEATPLTWGSLKELQETGRARTEWMGLLERDMEVIQAGRLAPAGTVLLFGANGRVFQVVVTRFEVLKSGGRRVYVQLIDQKVGTTRRVDPKAAILALSMDLHLQLEAWLLSAKALDGMGSEDKMTDASLDLLLILNRTDLNAASYRVTDFDLRSMISERMPISRIFEVVKILRNNTGELIRPNNVFATKLFFELIDTVDEYKSLTLELVIFLLGRVFPFIRH